VFKVFLNKYKTEEMFTSLDVLTECIKTQLPEVNKEDTDAVLQIDSEKTGVRISSPFCRRFEEIWEQIIITAMKISSMGENIHYIREILESIIIQYMCVFSLWSGVFLI